MLWFFACAAPKKYHHSIPVNKKYIVTVGEMSYFCSRLCSYHLHFDLVENDSSKIHFSTMSSGAEIPPALMAEFSTGKVITRRGKDELGPSAGYYELKHKEKTYIFEICSTKSGDIVRIKSEDEKAPFEWQGYFGMMMGKHF